MRFEVLKDDFQRSLQLVQHSVSSRSVMPVLSGVMIEADEGKVSLFTTDLESSTTTQCEARVEAKGACVVSHRLLLELFRDLKDEKVILELTGNELQVMGENNTFKLFTMPKDDYPGHPLVETPVMEILDPRLFSHSVQVVSKAASKDEKRPTLTGVFMDFDKEELRLVSTDSYRLAVMRLKGAHRTEQDGSYIIPATALSSFSKIMGEEGVVRVFRDEGSGQLRFDDNG